MSGRVTSTMVTTVTPADQGASVSCTADNSHLVQAQSASVVLDVIGIKCYPRYDEQMYNDASLLSSSCESYNHQGVELLHCRHLP